LWGEAARKKNKENTRYYIVFHHQQPNTIVKIFGKTALVLFQPISKGLLFACEDLVCRPCTVFWLSRVARTFVRSVQTRGAVKAHLQSRSEFRMYCTL
jgi:hypothetical protein